MRISTSLVPPAPKGKIMVTERLGYGCAWATGPAMSKPQLSKDKAI
jgi:hypothetical protein